jgi:hypothetical protein
VKIIFKFNLKHLKMSLPEVQKSHPKHKYSEMIQTALLTLNERKGSSRQAIWKVVEAKFPESNYKQLIARLKKLSEEDHIERRGKINRYFLDKKFKERALKALEKGVSYHQAVT